MDVIMMNKNSITESTYRSIVFILKLMVLYFFQCFGIWPKKNILDLHSKNLCECWK